MDLKRPATNGETDMFYEGSNPSGVTNRKVGIKELKLNYFLTMQKINMLKIGEVKRNWYRP